MRHLLRIEKIDEVSLVDAPACTECGLMIAKSEGDNMETRRTPPEGTEKQAGTSAYVRKLREAFPGATCLKDIGEAVLDRMGREQQAQDPLLTREQAYTKALLTETGREIYAWAHQPDARLPLERAVEKAGLRSKLEALGYRNWGDCVSQLAKRFSPEDFNAGLKHIEKHYPQLWQEFTRERYGT